jgi:epoxyqueuosine reductase QueG
MEQDLKIALIKRLKQVGAYDVRVADPRVGFEYALHEKHPLVYWPACKSIIVYCVPRSPEMNNTYLGPYSLWNGDRHLGPVPNNLVSSEYALIRLSNLFMASVTLKGMLFLQTRGYETRHPEVEIQLKLCAYESGLGVYGRSGLILHPGLGNRMILGAILTDALLEPDPPLEDFSPCEDCSICITGCPAHAYDATKEYPDSWSKGKCLAKREEILKAGLFCHNCFAVCPAGRLKDDELFLKREAVSFYKRKRNNGV